MPLYLEGWPPVRRGRRSTPGGTRKLKLTWLVLLAAICRRSASSSLVVARVSWRWAPGTTGPSTPSAGPEAVQHERKVRMR